MKVKSKKLKVQELGCRPILSVFVLALISIVLSGCALPDVSQKAVTLHGYNAITKGTVAFDPITGTPAPEALFIVCNGLYISVPVVGQDSCKFYSFYSEEYSSSIFNSSAKSYTCVSVFVTTDKALMQKYTQAISDRLKSPHKSIESESQPDSVPAESDNKTGEVITTYPPTLIPPETTNKEQNQ